MILFCFLALINVLDDDDEEKKTKNIRGEEATREGQSIDKSYVFKWNSRL